MIFFILGEETKRKWKKNSATNPKSHQIQINTVAGTFTRSRRELRQPDQLEKRDL